MGDDGIRMTTASTADAMGRIAAAGQTMAGDWRTVGAEIAGLAGQLGKGDLGAAFIAGYQGPAAQVARDADQYCQEPDVLAGKGNRSVDTYGTADATSRDVVSAVETPPLP